METICQVAFRFMTRDEATRAESVLREYLLRHADQMAMTRKGDSWLTIFPMPHPLWVHKMLSKLTEEDIAAYDTHKWTFNLTVNVKNLFNQSTFFHLNSGGYFSGLTDPKFYSNGQEIASYIASEMLLTFHISDTDKAELSNLGVYMDTPEI